MSPSAGGLVVFLLSVQVIQSLDGWGVNYDETDVCAAKGSVVGIYCTFTHPSGLDRRDMKNILWFTKEKDGEPVDLRKDPEYSARVEYRCSKNSCTLIITDVRESDSAEYKFTLKTTKPGEKYTGSPGVTLSVTGFQVQVRRSDSTWLELTCHSSCVLSDDPEYDWYKNGENIETGSSLLVSSGSTDRYSCYLRGSSGQRSPAVYGPQRLSVSASPSAEMLEGDSVTLTCSADANPAANYTWKRRLHKKKKVLTKLFPGKEIRQLLSPPAEPCHASVNFSRNQEDLLYSNIRPARPPRHTEEVQNSSVNFKRAGGASEGVCGNCY